MEKSNPVYRIAIVGRPNVGKSSLFNRIAGRRHAIIERIAGTTRDRLSAIITRKNIVLEIVDTGGFNISSKDHISKLVKKQIGIAIERADIILFVCDVMDGITPQDEEMLPVLRKLGKDTILVVNKVDNDKLRESANEFYAFGLKSLYAVSALHNIGISSLMDGLTSHMEPGAETGAVSSAIKVAIIGRPNVGKSSFVNNITGEERVIVHEEPGTTRDSIDIHLTKEGRDFILIDTAGMRHKRKVKEAVGVYSLLRATASVRRSDVCIVMMDAYEGMAKDDMRVLGLVEECGKGCILIVNKWDLVSGCEMSRYEKALIKKMDYVRNIPLVFTSCKTGLNLKDVFRLVLLVHKNVTTKFSQEELDGILNLMYESGRIPIVRSGKLVKIYSIRQKDATPPSFDIFVNQPAFVTDDYLKAIKNVLRGELGLRGVPIKIWPKKGKQVMKKSVSQDDRR